MLLTSSGDRNESCRSSTPHADCTTPGAAAITSSTVYSAVINAGLAAVGGGPASMTFKVSSAWKEGRTTMCTCH